MIGMRARISTVLVAWVFEPARVNGTPVRSS
jgi:hypothetical protein